MAFQQASSNQSRTLLWLVLLSAGVWLSILVYTALMGINRYAGDVVSYWVYSQHLNEFNTYHLPLYPFVLSILGAVVPGVHPIFLMSIITFTTWMIGIVATYRLLQALETRWAWVGALLMGVFPLVGAAFSLVPIADVTARAWVLLALLAYVKDRKWLTVGAMALALLTHKVTWVNVVIIALVGLYQHRLQIYHVLAAGIPLGLYTLLGAAYHGSLTWIFSATIEHTRIATHVETVFPIFDTFLGRFANGGAVNFLMGGIVLVLVLVALFLLWTRVWVSQPVLLATILPTIVVSAVMAAASSMVVLRFSPVLLIPLWLYVFPAQSPRFQRLNNRVVLAIILCAALVSQFAFVSYIQFYQDVN